MHCGAVGWLGDIDPRHRRRIIAAAIGVGCEKREVSGLSFLRRTRKEDRRNGQETMESIEIKSKRNIRRKRYENIYNGKKKRQRH